MMASYERLLRSFLLTKPANPRLSSTCCGKSRPTKAKHKIGAASFPARKGGCAISRMDRCRIILEPRNI